MDCHTTNSGSTLAGVGSIALVGHPNVGKSVLFQRLTGQRVIVSNYPGTTVEVSRSALRDQPNITLVDTPGVIAFPPKSDDERVTEQLLLDESLNAIVQVGDAKNLRRTLLFTVQLAEMGVPMVLALNMMDEANTRGVVIQHQKLAERLGLPIIPTTAIRNQGVKEIDSVLRTITPINLKISYPQVIEDLVTELSFHIPNAPISKRAMALLWLSDDKESEQWLLQHAGSSKVDTLEKILAEAQKSSSLSLSEIIQNTRLDYIRELADDVLTESGSHWRGFSASLGTLTTHPVWGVFIMLAVLYGMYWFVGIFGAGTLVGLLEENMFGEWLNPLFTEFIQKTIPVPFISDFIVGEYGLWTMGMTYAVALIFPIVTTFFLTFGIMEDSGYLPRLAALSNRMFSAIGLNGKAVLPMVLGLGCVTMGTITTRVLETKRERLLVTLLLALAIPCSAQLGVVMGMLGSISLAATMIWGGVVMLVLLAVGWLAAKLVPGERTQLLVELPPMRLPVASNVIFKTLARLEWYLKEVVPLFLVGTAILFILDKTSMLAMISNVGKPLVSGWLGLPPEASVHFLMGFLRRDFGATGLFIMQQQDLLSPAQVIVSMVTITLFIPCVASVMIIKKERSWHTSLGIVVLVFGLAFLVGGLLRYALLFFGWS
ncbi:MAG: ferrous iron transport protein B [Anaerolineae bacterium]|jgi:ferrous iron transport protein B|nr:ferrous iron transport protein B [Anaerolineae bacterium]MBT4843707.1 ferrous iron transport protein B [Anaerolineae bacterium]MBT6813896.1 ferrous iron transport protein B [Anaerolineae bacterium]MBT7017393.1 ferrous iron transport protein B [Anaerolineae bacterium]MBT7602418.1 ferrous iron transport protein B [Anaerolineae bacterium]